MGRGLLLAVFAGAVLFSASTANAAGYVTGNDLYRICRGNANEQRECMGYLEAAADGIEALRVSVGKPQCVRTGVEVGQIRDVVLKYLGALSLFDQI
jgi:hypothetical protein